MINTPNFFLVGAPKAGTTALYHRLREHPDVFMSSVKEPHFFSGKTGNNLPLTMEDYLALFATATNERAVGEASPSYLHSPSTPQRIFEFSPDSRIIVVLRQPVERAYSHYLMMLNSGAAPSKNFEKVFLDAHAMASRGGVPSPVSGYQQSWYAEALQRYYDIFPQSQIFVTTNEYLKRDPHAVLQRIFQFLDVSADLSTSGLDKKHNVGLGIPRSQVAHSLVFSDNPAKSIARLLIPKSYRKRIVRFIARRNATEKTNLHKSVVQNLTKIFYNDIDKTERLTGLSLQHWK